MLELDCFVAIHLKKCLHCKNSVGQMHVVGLFVQCHHASPSREQIFVFTELAAVEFIET